MSTQDVMSGPSSNHGHPMHTHQHQQPHQQPHHQQYGQGIPYQRLHGHNPPVHTPPSGQGPLMRFLPVGHTHLNQVRGCCLAPCLLPDSLSDTCCTVTHQQRLCIRFNRPLHTASSCFANCCLTNPQGVGDMGNRPLGCRDLSC